MQASTSHKHNRRVTHKRTDLPALVNLNPLFTKADKSWFRAKYVEMLDMRDALERAAVDGLIEVMGLYWYKRYTTLLSMPKGTRNRDVALAIRLSIRNMAINTAHTFMCKDTLFLICIQKQAVFEAMASLRRQHPVVDVRAVMHDVFLEHGDPVDRVRNRKVVDSRYAKALCKLLSKSRVFVDTYKTYRGVYV